jgi:hypothetical protein
MEVVTRFHRSRSRLLGLLRYDVIALNPTTSRLTIRQELVLRVDRIESGELTVEQTLKTDI